MAALTPGLNAIRWTGPTQAIRDSDLFPVLVAAYAINPFSGQGYIGFTKDDNFPSLKIFIQGYDYLVNVASAYTLATATAAAPGAFASFPGYTSAPTTTAPPAPGNTSTAIAAVPIIGGRLVAQTINGLMPYTARTIALKHLLLGLAMNSAQPGGSVTVLRAGYGNYPGLGLAPNLTFYAGDNGQLVSDCAGMAFSQVVGRSLSADELILRPESIILLAQ